MTTTLLTTLEVAERLGLSAAAVAQAVRSGQLEPAARTADDFLFNERSVTAYEQARSLAAAEPAPPAPPSSRSEWAGELGRLNSWLSELNSSLAAPTPIPAGPTQPNAEQPLDRSQEETIEAQTPAESVADPDDSGPAEPAPTAASTAAAPAKLEDDLAVEPRHPESSQVGREVSRQAVLVVQPITRFRTVGEVASALSGIPGLADVRLERMERGVASYRLTMGGEPPSGDEIAEALSAFQLKLLLVESAG
ncbi:MAG: hypothetical protein M3Z13_05625 [Candidatus Dormibacteraeota bacterium]|nr:hypothetical protein [Candidatus Dormibacteraeota bacterium]